MLRKNWLSIVAFIILMTAIGFGGPYLTSVYFKNYKNRINKNGIVSKAVIFKKGEHKGNTLSFEYSYKNEVYRNSEPDETSFFDEVNMGDTINILLDSTNPSDSYIMRE